MSNVTADQERSAARRDLLRKKLQEKAAPVVDHQREAFRDPGETAYPHPNRRYACSKGTRHSISGALRWARGYSPSPVETGEGVRG
jgi:hypothetical protein